MRHRDYSNPLPFRDEMLQVFIPRMYYNYRIETRPYDEPAAMLFTSATRKSVIPPSPVRLSWDCRHPPPESVRTDGRTYADVRTKIFRINGLPNFLTHGAPRAPLLIIIIFSKVAANLLSSFREK